MNKTQKNFWLDMVLLFAFIVIIISSFVLDNRDYNLIVWGLARPAWVMMHAVAGLAMLAGSGLHLFWHWDWIKAAFKRTNRGKRSMRRNRAVDICLFGLLILTSLSGVFVWPMSGNLSEGNPLGDNTLLGIAYHAWKSLHAWSGMLMFIVIIVHLALHWHWIVSMTPSYLIPGVHPRTERPGNAETVR